MRVLGICFAGTSTAERQPMATFVSEVLGVASRQVEGVEADLFELPDGSSFAVASPGGMGNSARSLGFLVASLDEAVAELKAAGIATGCSRHQRDRAIRPLHRTGRAPVRAGRASLVTEPAAP